MESINCKYTVTSQMWAPPLTRQPSKDILLIKYLEFGVAVGVAVACCSAFYTFIIYGHPVMDILLMGTL